MGTGAVPYALELPQDRALTYAAVYCRYCGYSNDLTPHKGSFICTLCSGRSPRYVPSREGLHTTKFFPADPEWVEDIILFAP